MYENDTVGNSRKSPDSTEQFPIVQFYVKTDEQSHKKNAKNICEKLSKSRRDNSRKYL